MAASRSTAAERFSLDGNENEIVASLTFSGEDLPFFRITAYRKNGVSGVWIDTSEERREASVPFSLMRDENFRVRHFVKGIRITYTGYEDFLWGQLTGYGLRQRISNLFAQYVFNISTKFRRDRIDLLKAMVEQDISHEDGDLSFNSRRKFSKFMTMGELYGYRIYAHPKFKSEDRRFELLIESLVQSGDLGEDGDSIMVTGKAIETITKHEAEERRHHDTVRQSWLMILLTLVIAGSTLYSIFE